MKISSMQELEEAILALERKKEIQKNEITAEFKNTVESLKPMNLLKSTFKSNHLATTLLKTAGGLGIGLLTNKLAGATLLKSSKPASFVGGLVKSSLSAAVLGNRRKIKAYGTAIFKNLFGNKKNT